MDIKVLGSGCSKCMRLYDNALVAIQEMGIEALVEKVTGMPEIASWGVMSTPALVVDGRVVSMGRVLTKEQIKLILQARGMN